MAVEDLAALAQRWRRAGGSMARVRVVADGARALAGLSADERRLLARGLSERGAPELADRVVATTGGTLSGGELTEAVRQLFSLDVDQLRDVAGELRDPDARRALTDRARDEVGALATEASAAVAPSVVAAATVPLTGGPPRPADAEPARDTARPGGAAPPTDETAAVETAAIETAAADAPVTSDPGVSPVPPSDEAVVDPVDVDVVLTALADAGSAHRRFVVLRGVAGQALDGAAVVRILDAVPPGWQRRRAATRLVADGEITTLDPTTVLSRFDRGGDRIVVAAALVDHGLVAPDAIADLVPERAAARLRRRVGG